MNMATINLFLGSIFHQFTVVSPIFIEFEAQPVLKLALIPLILDYLKTPSRI